MAETPTALTDIRPAVGVVGAVRQAGENREQRQRLDDHQQHDEEFDQFVEHRAFRDSAT